MNPKLEKTEENQALAVFTALEPLAVGGLIGLLLVAPREGTAGLDWAALVVLGTGLLALAVSLLHLGRPWRAPLAILHLSASWLSREVMLFGLFLMAVLAYMLLPLALPGHPAVRVIGICAAVLGLLATIATGETYRLHSRPSWDHWLTSISFLVGALSTGAFFGFFIASRFNGGIDAPKIAWTTTSIFLWISLAVSVLRSIRRPVVEEGRESRQRTMGAYLWLLLVRAAAVLLAFGLITMGEGMQFLAWMPALVGELADRFLFFETVVPVSLRKRFL